MKAAALLALGALLLIAPGVDAASASAELAAAREQIFRSLLDRHAGAVVNVEYVLSVRFMGQSNDQDSVATGVIISPDGVVLLTRSLVQPDGEDFRFGDGRVEPPVFESRDFRVTVAGTGRIYDAELIARDPDLDLLWIRLEGGPDETFAWVDFSRSQDFHIGQAVYAVDRLGTWFGNAPYVRAGAVVGETRIPRRFGILSIGAYTGPVFDADARPLGLIVNPRDREVGSGGGWAGLLRDGLPQPFLLPGALVDQANDRALEAARNRD